MSWKGKLIVALVWLAIIGGGMGLAHANGYTLDALERDIADAPVAIFVCALIVLPPLGVPLTFFLFAVGAKLGVVTGSLVGCGALVVHHLMAAGGSLLIERIFEKSKFGEGEGASIWRKLEEKFGEETSKLVFIFALIPGPPYIIKLYLPLAMGVKRSVYVINSSVAHMVGAVLFVGLGGAVLKQSPWLIGGLLVALVALAGGLAVMKRRQTRSTA